VRRLYETGSIDEHTQLWWSVRPHLAFPTVEIRICDAQPELAEAQSIAALCYALTARIARAADEGEPLPDRPHGWNEQNDWRATWSRPTWRSSRYVSSSPCSRAPSPRRRSATSTRRSRTCS